MTATSAVKGTKTGYCESGQVTSTRKPPMFDRLAAASPPAPRAASRTSASPRPDPPGTDPLPLVVMTPKSLLRQRLTASTLTELADGRWQPILDDVDASTRADEITRLVLCSGKVYVDIASHEQRSNHPHIALVRVEQLYPFPMTELGALLDQYANVGEVVWLQEEPANMGAWEFAQPRLLELINDRCPLYYVGRPRRASPAEGSTAWHNVNQAAIVAQVFAKEILVHRAEPYQTVETLEAP
jgi:2-oxoglutarate dehydrogenase E1 component